MDRRLVGGRDPAHGALRHRLAGRRRDAGRCRQVVAAIKQAAAEAGRTIDEDHYGAAFPFYFGMPVTVPSAAMDAYAKRTGRDPARYFAIGDEKVILDRVAEYVAVGVEKFILRPVGRDGDAIIAQTRQLIEKVLPLVEARWPKRKDGGRQGGAAADEKKAGETMHIGAAMFFTDYSMAPGELAQGAGGARLRIGVGARALAHPAVAQVAVSRAAASCPRNTTTRWTRSWR